MSARRSKNSEKIHRLSFWCGGSEEIPFRRTEMTSLKTFLILKGEPIKERKKKVMARLCWNVENFISWWSVECVG